MRKYFILLLYLPLVYVSFFGMAVLADNAVTVRVGIYENHPKIFTDEKGNASGFWPDIIEYVASKEGWKIEYVHGIWAQCLSRLEKNEIDIMPDVAYTDERAKLYDFSDETVYISWSRVYAREGVDIQSILDLEGKNIAVLEGSVNVEGPEGIKELVSEFNIDCNFVELNSYTEVFEMVDNGDADAGITNKDFYLQNREDYHIERTAIIFQPASLYFAFPKGSDLSAYLTERIDYHMKELKEDGNSIYYESMDRWLGVRPVEKFGVPGWVKWLLIGIGSLAVLLIGGSFILRYQIRTRTKELSAEIIERKRAENRLELTAEILQILNKPGKHEENMRMLLHTIKQHAGVEVIGIRLKEGDDYPYFSTEGFVMGHVEAENSLCTYDLNGQLIRDEVGNPVLECMCGNIVHGRFDPKPPFFTERGSFWTNCTTELLASTTEEDRQARTRDRCNGEGYESVALIPIRTDNQIIGLLQLNDTRKNMFSPEKIHFFEDIGASIGIAFERTQADEALHRSEQNFRNSLDESPFGVVINQAMGKALYINKAALDLFGYRDIEEMRNTPVAERHIPENVAKFKERWERIEKGEFTSEQDSYYIKRKNGEMRFVEAYFKKMVWGGQDCIQVIFHDITERKEAEETFRILAEESPVGIYIIQGGKFVYTNLQFQKDTGYSADELLNMESLNLVIPEDRDEVRRNAIRMLRGELITPYEFRVINKNGDVKWSMESVTSIRYRGKRAALGSYQDITDRKQMTEQLIVTDRLASVGELASGIAHELNNPLTSVIGFSDLLMAKENAPEDIREDLTIINREAKRAAQVARHLLTFARKHPDEKQPTYVNNIIRLVLELREYEQRVNNIEVETTLGDDLPPVLANDFQLQQVFINIIINAEHFMIKEHGRGVLAVGTGHHGDIVRIYISDDGPGITPENLSHIFDPFYTTKEVGKGTGLGLSICYGIITEHGGKIYAESELGKGATFIIELPAHGDGQITK